MRITTKPGTTEKSWASRLGWFALLYILSFAAVVAVAYGLKAIIAA